MSAVISSPYLRWLTRVLRWALRGLGLVVLITALAWALLHAWIVPRIDQWRPEITQWVSARLGVPVEIARIQATSNGWRPDFQLRQVRLLKPNGEPALTLPEVKVQAKGVAEASEGLRFVRQSPVAQWLDGDLDSTRAHRLISIKIRLILAISNINAGNVNGEVGLQGNDIALRNDVPLLRNAQGRVAFDEHGFSLRDVQAMGLGGAVTLKGGTEAAPGNVTRTVIEASGRATAQGLRGEAMLAAAAPLLVQASGETATRTGVDAIFGRKRR